jgi:hypothetical protein
MLTSVEVLSFDVGAQASKAPQIIRIPVDGFKRVAIKIFSIIDISSKLAKLSAAFDQLNKKRRRRRQCHTE